MPTVTQELKTIQERVGNVGVDKLYAAARRKGVPGVTRETVRLFLSTDASKQLFKPLPESKGKTGAEAQQFRVQMDLIDMKYSPSKSSARGPGNKNAVILVDVLSRFAWGAPCVSKDPEHVEPVLRRILNGMVTLPVFISSDKGNEFTGAVAKLLDDKGITHRTKSESHDMNALAVVDRVIQTLKKRLAESLAANKGEWAQRLPIVIKQYNATPHPAIHGDEPNDFGKTGHEVAQFMTQAENADKLQFNQKLLEKRKTKLAEEGGFRVPVGAPKAFHRGFKQAYSGQAFEIERIEGSTVKGKDGTKVDVKRALPVHAASGHAEPGFALGDARVQAKKDKLVTPLMVELYTFLSPGERVSLSSAATHLKEQLGAAKYKEILKSVGFQHLAQAVRLFDHEFTVDNKGYYMRRL